MKVKFLNAENLLDGIELVSEDLNFTVSDGAEFTIELEKIEEDKLLVSLKDNYAKISFKEKARFFRGLAYVIDSFKNGVKEKEITETPLFKTNGAMFDMSRNVVMNVKSVKLLFRKMALMGLNTFMLYTEDTYEVEGYPYFGHLRGRYSKDELKELDAYALKLGIELVPCIQTLGHLATHLQWADAGRYKDGNSTLLVGSDETYKLIDAMFKTITECFTSKRVHIGMDETFDLGTGAYLEKNGYKPRDEIYFEQMEKVKELAKKYDLKPMMWSDMIFRLAGKNIKPYEDYHCDVEFTPEVIKKIPKGVQPVFWDYYHDSEKWYDINVKKHQTIFEEEMLFAGGIWLWSGFCPLYSVSFKNSIAGLEAVKKNNGKEVMATIWLNGAESSLIMALTGLAWYASFDYAGGLDMENIKETFRITCNGNYDDIMLFEKIEQALEGIETCSRAIFYSDPLLGIADKHLTLVKDYYDETTKLLKNAKVNEIFKPATDLLVKISDLFSYKGDFGIRIKSAYDKKDKKELKKLLKECDIIIKKIIDVKNAHRASWYEYNKSFGWEVHDIRYGGVIARFETVKTVLKDYLDGKIEKIEELEENRVAINSNVPSSFLWSKYTKYATTGIL